MLLVQRYVSSITKNVSHKNDFVLKLKLRVCFTLVLVVVPIFLFTRIQSFCNISEEMCNNTLHPVIHNIV